MFALYTLYWALDLYFLWAEYDSRLSPRPESSHGPNMQNVHWKGASYTDQDGLAPRYFVIVYVQYVLQLVLVSGIRLHMRL